MPRAGLTHQRVIEEAARLADAHGYDRLTLAAVAASFGVRLPSLYKHVAGVEALREGVAVLAVDELAEELRRAAVGRAGADALRAMAKRYRAYAQRHPGRYAATIRAAGPSDIRLRDASEALLGVVLAVLAGYGLGGDEAIDATRSLRSALHGFVSLEAAGGFGLPQDVDRSFARLVEALDLAFRSWTSVAP